MTQALYLGDFLYSDSSLPSNFTVFAFHEQEPNSSNQQTDYLICHLVQKQGQKKSLDEIKASLKQTVHVRTQLQLFATTSSIFFGSESICSEKLNQLLLLVGQNKKPIQDQIALDEFFAAKFLFAVDRRVQRWLRSCEQAVTTPMQVNDNILNFDDLLEQILNGVFQMNLPASFKKVVIPSKIAGH